MTMAIVIALTAAVTWCVAVWDERHPYDRVRRVHEFLHIFGRHAPGDFMSWRCYICEAEIDTLEAKEAKLLADMDRAIALAKLGPPPHREEE